MLYQKVPKRFQECAVSLGALPLAALIISIHKRGRFNLQAMMHRAASKF